MKKYITGKQAKSGEYLFFPEMDVSYLSSNPKLRIDRCRVNKVYKGDNEFSTRNEGDRYEVVRVIAYRTKEDAKEGMIKNLKSYKKSIIKTLDSYIEQAKNL